MKFQPVILNSEFLGYSAKSPNCIYFFGSANCTRDLLKTVFPEYEFCFLKQVHGNELLEATSEKVQVADAHWTKQRNLALVVQTADCMPILMGGEDLILAAHAGWRGVEQGLPEKCATFFCEQTSRVEGFAIGPHIQASEFEVGADVAERLARAAPHGRGVQAHPDPTKRWVDLSFIATLQMQAVTKSVAPTVLEMSTLSDLRFHSYRRGKAKDARQYSFIARP